MHASLAPTHTCYWYAITSNLMTIHRLILQGSRSFWAAFLLFWLSGCQSKFDIKQRKTVFSQVVGTKRAEARLIRAHSFPLQTVLLRAPSSTHEAIVYIEGDGLSWLTPYQVSADPTPTFPVALDLISPALTAQHQIYLARPCQYVSDHRCNKWVWTGAVYGQLQKEALSSALSIYKAELKIRQFHLVGYSGGGVLAMLLAAERDDIGSVMTVASNIDVDSWVQFVGISRLPESFNPRHNTKRLCGKHYHFVWGAEDTVVPFASQKSFAELLAQCAHVNISVIPKYRHDSDWSHIVTKLLVERQF